ncbi:hypothetical protein Y1Q_0009147 [Alligator mississippiensis]|uniref:Uncharacterized protein n=1 Tax=Alligator mississippiensis TaxID=8496 RepID=A0A151M2L4_ALLMI|nr:hypothetical protein Y1Q_0009147 [Alligator mississippiensis]
MTLPFKKILFLTCLCPLPRDLLDSDMCFLHYGQLKYVPFSSILFSPVVRPLQEFENPCIEPSSYLESDNPVEVSGSFVIDINGPRISSKID